LYFRGDLTAALVAGDAAIARDARNQDSRMEARRAGMGGRLMVVCMAGRTPEPYVRAL
jgi:hypothetical protein